jgi:CRP-like cAMP-binding protein
MAIQGENLDRSVQALRHCPLFRGLPEEPLRAAAAQAQLLQLEPGEELFRPGEAPGGLAVVLSGELRVLVPAGRGGEPVEVARFAPVQPVGITGVLLGRPGQASVAASAISTVLRFAPPFLEQMAAQVPAVGLEVARTLAERLERAVGAIPVAAADEAQVGKGGLPGLLPRGLMARLRVFPLAQEGPRLTLGLADEPAPEVLERVRGHLPGVELLPVRLTPRQFERLMAAAPGADAPSSAPATDPALLERMLRAMVAEGASDLHLAGGQRPRWRIDGEMRELPDAPALGADVVLRLLGPVMPERNRREFETLNDTDFAHGHPRPGALPRQPLPRPRRGRRSVPPDPEHDRGPGPARHAARRRPVLRPA